MVTTIVQTLGGKFRVTGWIAGESVVLGEIHTLEDGVYLTAEDAGLTLYRAFTAAIRAAVTR